MLIPIENVVMGMPVLYYDTINSRSNKSIKYRDLAEKYSLPKSLENICFNNVVIAGKCIWDYLIGKTVEYYDIYTYGIDKDKYDRINIELVELITWNNPCDQLNVVSYPDVIIINNIRINLKQYKDIEDILAKMDFGCEAFAFDGKQIWCNEEGESTYANKTIKASYRFDDDYVKKLMTYFREGLNIDPRRWIDNYPHIYFGNTCNNREYFSLVLREENGEKYYEICD
jgi:hypothetical protein